MNQSTISNLAPFQKVLYENGVLVGFLTKEDKHFAFYQKSKYNIIRFTLEELQMIENLFQSLIEKPNINELYTF